MADSSVICAAIQGRNLIQIYYYDPEPGYRIVQPYTLGYNRANHLMLNGWFIEGASASGEGPGYRDYLLDKISTVEILNQHFAQPAPGYVPMGGKKFQSVLCDLSMY
ncbi:MAG: WYL domain-containing protein [Acidobacteriota bacterium]